MNSVLLEWMLTLTWKQQSVILSSLRGPDSNYYPNIKKLTKWLRAVIEHNADQKSSYMYQEELPCLDFLGKELEFTTVHYASHLLSSLEIIAYKHPNADIAKVARGYYGGLVKGVLNLNPEN